jgi:voltage-gated potassium channel
MLRIRPDNTQGSPAPKIPGPAIGNSPVGIDGHDVREEVAQNATMRADRDDPASEKIARASFVRNLEHTLEIPMLVLGLAWIVLLILEFAGHETRAVQLAGTVIWVIFLAEFAIKFLFAPEKGAYLKRNWLTAISLVIPGLRVLRIAKLARVLRAARAVRALRLVRVVTGLNRGMRTLRRTMRRRGLGYVLLFTLLVAFAGAAGMYAFENADARAGGFDTYASSLWWTLMLLTSLGSEFWPRTAEGRLLCLGLSIYGFAVFGYITAALASFFVGRDAEVRK